MQITTENIINGVRNTKWHYRMQKITNGEVSKILPKDSVLYIDGAHNISAAKVLADFLRDSKNKDGMDNFIINGRTKDTDSIGFLKQFVGAINCVVAIRVKMEALPENPIAIAEAAKSIGIDCYIGSSIIDSVKIISCIANGIDIEKRDEIDISKFHKPVRICICGSFYLARDLKIENNDV